MIKCLSKRKLLEEHEFTAVSRITHSRCFRSKSGGCYTRRPDDPPPVPLFGHQEDPGFRYRGQLQPPPQGAQPPPPQRAQPPLQPEENPPPPPRRAQRCAQAPLPPPRPRPPPPRARRVDQLEDSDDEDNVPINQRRPAVAAHLARQPTPIRQGIVEDAFGARERFGDDLVQLEVETVVHQVLSAELTSAERYIREIAREDPLPLLNPLHPSLLNFGQDRPGPSQRADSPESSMMSRVGGQTPPRATTRVTPATTQAQEEEDDGTSRYTEPMPVDEPAGEATDVPMTQAERNAPPAPEFEMAGDWCRSPLVSSSISMWKIWR